MQEIKEKKFTAAASGRDSDDFYRIRLQKVDLPPRTGFALGFCTPFPVVFRAGIAIVTVASISSSYSRRLIRWFAKSNICACDDTTLWYLNDFPLIIDIYCVE